MVIGDWEPTINRLVFRGRAFFLCVHSFLGGYTVGQIRNSFSLITVFLHTLHDAKFVLLGSGLGLVLFVFPRLLGLLLG
jgi:hypothetical protein